MPQRAQLELRHPLAASIYSTEYYTGFGKWRFAQFRWRWVRTFKTKAFTRFAEKEGISDATLCRSVQEAERGLVAADLGGGVIKQRIARPGQGKSGGFRALIVFREGTRAIFVHGFAKNEKDNIGKDELAALKRLADELLAYDDKTLARVVAVGSLMELKCDEKTVS
jgi:hypothetical protein